MTDDLLRSPLHDRHEAAGARFAEFSGWDMPLQFSGTVEEHTAVRETVGLFDVSHMGNVDITGTGAKAWLNSCLTNDIDRIGPGQLQYQLLCDDETGGVIDDLMVYLIADDHVALVPNAGNTPEVVRRLQAAAPEAISIVDQQRDMAIIAVQGPRSAEVLSALGLPADMDYMRFEDMAWDGVPVRVARSGYTGEHGYELILPGSSAPTLWDALSAEVETLDGKLCGLGARDTLRTEMGYPLHGNELSIAITPIQAQLGFAVRMSKPEFWGRDVLEREQAMGAPRLLWGIKALDRGVPRPHMTVKSEASDDLLGEITSGTFSPTLQTGIALALLTRGVSEGDRVLIDVRGRQLEGEVVRPPFVANSTR